MPEKRGYTNASTGRGFSRLAGRPVPLGFTKRANYKAWLPRTIGRDCMGNTKGRAFQRGPDLHPQR